MDVERLQQLRDLFEDALPLDAAGRRRLLDERSIEGELRAEVESLLDVSEGASIGLGDFVPAPSRFAPGDTIGSYRIVERIGAGGMGEVYRAYDSNLEKDVAIKVLPLELSRDPHRLERFRTEARTLAALNHPHIVVIYHAGEFENSWFFVMEFVEGQTLAERLRAGAIPIHEALRIASQIAAALEAAHNHDRQIVHRDLKPANVMISSAGDLKVLDFGLSRTYSVHSTDSHTQGKIEGTPPYMSPEQLRGEAPQRGADIWAFGCVLYEMLTGHAAFQGNDEALRDAILRSEPNWNRLPVDTPRVIQDLLRSCLKKESALRLDAMGEARRALEGTLRSMEGGASVGLRTSSTRQWLMAVSLVLLAAAGLWNSLAGSKSPLAVMVPITDVPAPPKAASDEGNLTLAPSLPEVSDAAIRNLDTAPSNSPESDPPPIERRVLAQSRNPLNGVRDALERASNTLARAANQGNVQKPIAAIGVAIDDVRTAIRNNPNPAGAAIAAEVIPDFTPPARPGPNRNLILEAALGNLKTAFDALAQAPVGELDGLREKINKDIATAAADVIAAIHSSNEGFPRGRGRRSGDQGQ